MNENLNLVEILKECPKGTKLYSTVYGEVEFDGIENEKGFPIKYIISDGSKGSVTAQGLVLSCHDGECTLFPSREERNWDLFKVKKPKFDPNTLRPFDRVLVYFNDIWDCDLFSYIKDDFCSCVSGNFEYCIPYNDDTKHLVGTTNEAPEFYRYWED